MIFCFELNTCDSDYEDTTKCMSQEVSVGPADNIQPSKEVEESDSEYFTNSKGTTNAIIKLTKHIVVKQKLVNCWDKGDCHRPNTWATTAKGETRDFFRVLNRLY